MIKIIDDYGKYNFTKITVPIKLEKCPSDHENSQYYIDIIEDYVIQENCYIGHQLVKCICFKRFKKAEISRKIYEPEWLVEILIQEAKTEDEVINLIKMLCDMLSLNCIKQYFYIQNSGFRGFSFKAMDIKRQYGINEKDIEDTALNVNLGFLESSMLSTVKDVFCFSKQPIIHSKFYNNLQQAFFRALKCKDAISRYILLYYIFEIIYDTRDYKNIDEQLKNGSYDGTIRKNTNKHRSKILYQYFINCIGLFEYKYFEEHKQLTESILEKIILVRNNLAHSADTSEISQVMYKDMIPIVLRILLLLE